jgi:hypothetical protein
MDKFKKCIRRVKPKPKQDEPVGATKEQLERIKLIREKQK